MIAGRALGKKPAVRDPRNLKLSSYIDDVRLPSAPLEVDWSKPVTEWPVLGNDRYGNCVEVGAANLIHTWTANASKPVTLTEHDVLKWYAQLTGFNPDEPDTDQGTEVLAMLRALRSEGFCKHRIRAFVEVDIHRIDEIHAATWLFGGVIFGFALPKSIEADPNSRTWSMPPGGMVGDGARGSLGGHCVMANRSDAHGVGIITWGEKVLVEPAFVRAFADECYAIVTDDWIAADAKSPSGFAVDALLADLKAIR